MRSIAVYQQLCDRLLAGWNSQELDAAVRGYTDDIEFCDPGGDGQGLDELREHVAQVLTRFVLTYERTGVRPLRDEDGVILHWMATFQPKDGRPPIRIPGVDLLVFRGDDVCRAEVLFDRAPLLDRRSTA